MGYRYFFNKAPDQYSFSLRARQRSTLNKSIQQKIEMRTALKYNIKWDGKVTLKWEKIWSHPVASKKKIRFLLHTF